jgi:hypothetical protein
MSKRRSAPGIVRQLLTVIGAAATVIFTAQVVKPVFFSRTPVIERVLHPPVDPIAALVDSAAGQAPWLRIPTPLSLRTPQFAADSQAFVADLMATGKLPQVRAERIADAAVRQAYRRRIPPALVLGVMLTENDDFKPTAKSKQGAVGLMQVMPRIWTPGWGDLFGRDLRDDATNLRYGVYILRVMHDQIADAGDPLESYRLALLRYNGCVTGKNTPNCHRYPDVVERHVNRAAKETCGGRSFEECVVRPLWLSRRREVLERWGVTAPAPSSVNRTG